MIKNTFLRVMLIGLAIVFIGAGGFYAIRQAKAETVGSLDSGVTSRIKTLYTDLSALTFGTDTDSPDWGAYWNRIKTAAKWTPSTSATASDVSSTKTFTANGSRAATSGTYNISNLTVATVKNGTAFGVGQTGTVMAGTPCPLQQYHDSYAGVTETTNCSLGWIANPSPVTGDDARFTFTVSAASALAGATYTNNSKTFTVTTTISGATSLDTTGTGSPTASGTLTKASGTGDATITFSALSHSGGYDPRTGLTWSQLLLDSANTVAFSKTTNSNWSWNSISDADNVNVGSLTAAQLCSSSANPAGAGVWRLPTQKELMQAYIDGSFWNLTQPSANFWSVTEADANFAWFVALSYGSTDNFAKTTSFQVRCVR